MMQCNDGKEWDGSIFKPKRQRFITALRSILWHSHF